MEDYLKCKKQNWADVDSDDDEVDNAVKGSPVGGAVKGAAVGGAVKGSPVGGAVKGSPVGGAVKGAAVSGAVKGAVKGSPVGGAVKGAVKGAIKGAVKGAAVDGAVKGAVVDGVSFFDEFLIKLKGALNKEDFDNLIVGLFLPENKRILFGIIGELKLRCTGSLPKNIGCILWKVMEKSWLEGLDDRFIGKSNFATESTRLLASDALSSFVVRKERDGFPDQFVVDFNKVWLKSTVA
jgi:hypothetical protein